MQKTINLMWKDILASLRPRRGRIKAFGFVDTVPTHPVSFGHKQVWFAVKTERVAEIAGYFGTLVGNLKPMPTNWEKGVKAAYRGFCFITPPVDGWVLAVRPETDDIASAATQAVLLDLSRKYGEAHFYGNHRVVSYCAWAKATAGKLERVFSISDLTIAVSLGKRTESEEALLKKALLEEADPELKVFYQEQGIEHAFGDESDVMVVAGAWSINPQTLRERTDAGSQLGFVL